MFSAGSVLKMFQNALSDSTWKKGLFNYLAARGYDYATPDHLHENLQLVVDEQILTNRPDVALTMQTWETQSGFPYVTVTRNGISLKFEQNRFMYANRTSSNLWWIPINYVVGSNADFSMTQYDFWIPGTRATTIQGNSAPKLFTSNEWIIVNIQQTGFYRVNYDNSLWQLITKQLNVDFEKIHVLNRAQLVDDSFHLARASLIDFDIMFGILNYLKMETDYIPWASMDRANTLLNRWLTGSKVYTSFQAFMRKNVEALFNRLGMEVVENEARVDR